MEEKAQVMAGNENGKDGFGELGAERLAEWSTCRTRRRCSGWLG